MSVLARMDGALAEKGLTRLGAFLLGADEELLQGVGRRGGQVVLIGNEGRSLWARSGAEIEALKAKGVPNPLDHWTRASLDPLAADLGAAAFYPFAGPPYAPFTRWAERAPKLYRSPLGLTIHADYGLWHAFRAAFHFTAPVVPEEAASPAPCESCQDKPCLFSCPVEAFSAQGFDVEACKAHLADPDVACRLKGCLARLACPVGANWRYEARQARFHMEAFRPLP